MAVPWVQTPGPQPCLTYIPHNSWLSHFLLMGARFTDYQILNWVKLERWLWDEFLQLPLQGLALFVSQYLMRLWTVPWIVMQFFFGYYLIPQSLFSLPAFQLFLKCSRIPAGSPIMALRRMQAHFINGCLRHVYKTMAHLFVGFMPNGILYE